VILRKTLKVLLLALGVITSALSQQAAPKPFTVLFLGDSLTEGLGLETGEAFPDLIAARLKAEGRSDIKLINGGVSGSTSASALERLKWYARSRPDLMVLSLGANDGLRGVPVDEMRANLTETIEFAQQSGIKVALTGMMIPPNYGPEYTESFARVFPELAEKYQLPLLPFLLEGVAAVTELNQADGIHPNVEGAKKVAEHVYPFLADLLPLK
jgi:acyl-CoA thioesterase-1